MSEDTGRSAINIPCGNLKPEFNFPVETNLRPLGVAAWMVLGFEDFVTGFNALQGDGFRIIEFLESFEQLQQDFLRQHWEPANRWHWIGADDAHYCYYSVLNNPTRLESLRTYQGERYTSTSPLPNHCAYCLTNIPIETPFWVFADIVQEAAYCSEACGERARQKIFTHIPQLAELYLPPDQSARRRPQPLPCQLNAMRTYLNGLPPSRLSDEGADPDPWPAYQHKLTVIRR